MNESMFGEMTRILVNSAKISMYDRRGKESHDLVTKM